LFGDYPFEMEEDEWFFCFKFQVSGCENYTKRSNIKKNYSEAELQSNLKLETWNNIYIS
jgi:hypothetical protein